MPPPRLALLSNPRGHYNAVNSLTRVEAIARHAGVPHEIAADPDSIRAALVRLAAHRPDVLAVNGGDGTVDLVVSVLRSTDSPFTVEPALALLRGGTTNMIHRDVGLRYRPARGLQWLVTQQVLTPNASREPLLATRDDGSVTAGFFFCAGAIPRAILAVRGQGRHRTRLGEAWALLTALARLKFSRSLADDPVLRATDLHWHTAAARHDLPHIFIAASTLQHLIMSIRTNAGPGRVGLLTMQQDRLLRRDSASSLTVSADTPCMMDGEDLPAGDYQLTLGAPLRFVTDRRPA